MKIVAQLAICVLLFLIQADCQAKQRQQRPPKTFADGKLTLDTIYGRKGPSTGFFGATWQETGSKFVRSKPSPTVRGGKDLVAIEPQSGAETVLLRAEELIPTGKTKPIGRADIQWSKNRNLVLIFTNTRKVWRHNSRGDYWLLDRQSKKLRQIGADRPATSLMFAKISPDAKSVAYVSQGDVYVEDIASGATKKITEKSSPDIINGTSDWVYEEEFDLKDCFRWSPDSKKIAFWEFDTSEVGEFIMIDNTQGLYPKLTKFKHTKPGEKNSSVRMGFVHLGDGSTQWVNVEGDPREHYIARARWVDDNSLMMQRLNRDQNFNSVLIADATTGNTKELFRDTDDSWLETCDDLQKINDGQDYLWVSEKDGWRHVYALNAQTGAMKLLTPGDYDVISITRVTEDTIYFIASPDNPTERYLFSVPLSGGPAKRITPAGFKGTNQYQITPDGTLAFRTYSQYGVPPETELVSLPGHQTLRSVMRSDEMKNALATLAPVETEFLRVDVGNGVLCDAWVMKPVNMDPTKKYPLIAHVYGEPWGTTVTNSWGGSNYLWHRMLCEQGYAVCSIDNRGTKVPRGAKFRKSIYKKMAVIAAADQAAAIRALTKHFSWLDASRVGSWGWSGGGSMTLNALFRYPDVYRTGISIAAVPDIHYYDSIYQERYMSTPQKNPEGYKNASPINYAKNLKGNLLIVHGTGDDNCHYQTVELLINELVKQGKQFSMMAYPNRSHSINEGRGTTMHLRNLMTNYFLKNLEPGGK
ncbi:MAG: S9 family peptidase [Mariniblastus sp.]